MIERLYRPISPASLAAFRIVFAALMIWEILRHWGMLQSEFPAWEFWTLYEPLEFLRGWYRFSPEVVFPILTISLVAILLGCCTRLSATVFLVFYVYQFLLDPTHWNNHYYLISLLAFWLIFTRSQAIWSLDCRIRPSLKRESIPFWHIGVFQAQLAILYVYGGLAKFRGDWLLAEPVHPWLAVEKDNIPLIGSLLAEKGAAYFVAYFGLVFDLAIPFLLLYRRTRPYAIAVAIVFHATNTQLFEIGIFPFLGIGSLVVFLEPDTPRKYARRIANWGRRWLGLSEKPTPETLPAPSPTAVTNGQRIAAGLLVGYLVIQLLLPFRHFLFQGDVEWTEQGKHFAWRMMLSHKNTLVRLHVADEASGVIVEVDQGGSIAKTYGIPEGKRSLFVRELQPGVRQAMLVPEQRLSSRHRKGKGIWGNPRLLAQYSRYLASEARELGMKEPRVFADAVVSLNGRPFQYLVDPDTDLATAECPPWSTPNWIVQLEPNQPIGNYPADDEEFYKRAIKVIRSHHQAKVKQRMINEPVFAARPIAR